MKVIKYVYKNKRYLSKDGKERCAISYYLQLDNGVVISINPTFKNGYQALNTICELRIKD